MCIPGVFSKGIRCERSVLKSGSHCLIILPKVENSNKVAVNFDKFSDIFIGKHWIGTLLTLVS